MANETQTTETSNTDSSSSSTAATTATQEAPKTEANAAQTADTKTQQNAADTSTQTKDASKESNEGDKTKEANAKSEEKTAPESYADFKLPEGTKLDDEVTGEFKVLAKDLKLPQEQAQKIVDLGGKLATKWAAQFQDAIKSTQDTWRSDLKKDSQMGGEKLAENIGIAQRGLNHLDPSGKANALLLETGLSNNADIMRPFFAYGLTLKEDQVVTSNSGGSIMAAKGPGNLDAAAAALYAKS